MVPIYRIACEHVFGIKLAEGAASADKTAAFVEDDSAHGHACSSSPASTRKLPWAVRSPKLPSIEVHPGKLTEAWFDATNNASEAIVGNAVPSVAPNTASLYFNKTECFCFTEQMLKAGESRRMPVRFVVDPQLPKEVTELTLSYTFYENTVATQRVGRHRLAAAGGWLIPRIRSNMAQRPRHGARHQAPTTSRTAATGRSSARSACSARSAARASGSTTRTRSASRSWSLGIALLLFMMFGWFGTVIRESLAGHTTTSRSTRRSAWE